jgi:hypothetical protein
VDVGLSVAASVGVGVAVSVGVTTVLVGVGVLVGAGVSEGSGVAVSVGVGVTVTVGVAVSVPVGDAVTPSAAVVVGVAVGAESDTKLRSKTCVSPAKKLVEKTSLPFESVVGMVAPETSSVSEPSAIPRSSRSRVMVAGPPAPVWIAERYRCALVGPNRSR